MCRRLGLANISRPTSGVDAGAPDENRLSWSRVFRARAEGRRGGRKCEEAEGQSRLHVGSRRSGVPARFGYFTRMET